MAYDRPLQITSPCMVAALHSFREIQEAYREQQDPEPLGARPKADAPLLPVRVLLANSRPSLPCDMHSILAECRNGDASHQDQRRRPPLQRTLLRANAAPSPSSSRSLDLYGL